LLVAFGSATGGSGGPGGPSLLLLDELRVCIANHAMDEITTKLSHCCHIPAVQHY
jgi:hypothetical protein